MYWGLQFIWTEYSSTDAETSSFELGEVSIKICVEYICVSIYRGIELNWGIVFF